MLECNSSENTLARYSFISGITGAITIVVLSIIVSRFHIFKFSSDATVFCFIILAVVGIIMASMEICVRKTVDKKLLSISPLLTEHRIIPFLAECAVNFCLYFTLLLLIRFFFQTANEYGFLSGKQYYTKWFEFLNIIINIYLLAGIPYVLFTRALQYDTSADKKEPAYLLLKLIVRVFGLVAGKLAVSNISLFDIKNDKEINQFTNTDKIILTGLLVKIFFLPLMTVFFIDQFSHLVKNWDYLYSLFNVTAFSTDSLKPIDFYNISLTIIFSIDVGLAWCGYAISSRWLKNICVSVEPTFLGWFVALVCYPPYQQFLNFYYTAPPERGFLLIPNPWLAGALAVIAISSFFIYMSATVTFGLRFSNLTHRGIITRGPYSKIRHPAYAAKNMSWWFVMLPFIIWQVISGSSVRAFLQLGGLVILTGLYYLRALTEERHLRVDPDYIKYCEKVRYRFIPGII